MKKQKYHNENKTKRKRKKNYIIPIVFILIIGFVSYQVYLVQNSQIETIRAELGYINDSYISKGIVCREEVVINQDNTGSIHYLVEEGTRISAGTVVGEVYSDTQSVKTVERVDGINTLIENLEDVKGYVPVNTSDMFQARKSVTAEILKLASYNRSENYKSIADNISNLSYNINKVEIATGNDLDLNSAISFLESEKQQNISNTQPMTSQIITPRTGYFLKSSDGYEDVATVDNFLNISYQEGSDLLNNSFEYESDLQEACKIITNYKWNVCTYIPKEQADRLYVGQNINIRLVGDEEKYSKVKVIHLEEKDNMFLVVFESMDMDTISAINRVVDVEIVYKQYSGIKFPTQSIRLIEEYLGVYTKYLHLVKFKKIEPIYQDENYIIVPNEVTQTNQLLEYDEVIVKGKNLYDGKYL